MQREVANGVVHLGGAVDGGVLCVREVYEIDAVLLAVDGACLRALFAVVDDDLIVFAATDERLAARREVDAVDFVRVLTEHLRHAETPHHLIHQFHFHVCVEMWSCTPLNECFKQMCPTLDVGQRNWKVCN